MIGDQLRKSILQAAISGRLSERLPSDDDARELVAKIRAEKGLLVAVGDLKKETALPPVSEEEVPFEIPGNWVWVRLNEIVNFIDYRGMTPKKTTSGVRLVTATNVKPGYFDESRVEYISEEEYAYRNQRGTTRKGDILFTTEAPLGHCCINPYEVCSAGQRIITFQEYGRAEVSKPYLMYVIMGPYFQRALDLNRSGMTAHGIKAARLKLIPVPLPPLAEQERIVEQLDLLLAELAGLASDEIELEALRKSFPNDMRKSILQEAVSGRLTTQLPSDGSAQALLGEIREEKARLVAAGEVKKTKPLPPIAEDEIPFEIPSNWAWVRLGDLSFNRGQVVPDRTFSYIDIGSIDNKKNLLKHLVEFSPATAPSRARRVVGNGDIVYATVRPYLHNVCIVDRDLEPAPIASTGLEVVTVGRDDVNRFLFWALLSPMFDEYANASDNSKGVTYPAINSLRFRLGIVPIPPLAEIIRIVEKLDELLPLCEALE